MGLPMWTARSWPALPATASGAEEDGDFVEGGLLLRGGEGGEVGFLDGEGDAGGGDEGDLFLRAEGDGDGGEEEGFGFDGADGETSADLPVDGGAAAGGGEGFVLWWRRDGDAVADDEGGDVLEGGEGGGVEVDFHLFAGVEGFVLGAVGGGGIDDVLRALGEHEPDVDVEEGDGLVGDVAELGGDGEGAAFGDGAGDEEAGLEVFGARAPRGVLRGGVAKGSGKGEKGDHARENESHGRLRMNDQGILPAIRPKAA